MTTSLDTTSADYTEGFDEKAFDALTETSGVLGAKRKEAFEVYAATPSPTNQDEEWRKTVPELFSFKDCRPLPELQAAPQAETSDWDQHFDVVIEITDKGFSITDQTGALTSGTCSVMSFAEAAEARPELLEKRLQTAVPPSYGKFAALNAAFWNAGFLVEIPDKAIVEKGILFRYRIDGANAVLIPRLLVEAGKQSEARIVEHFVSPDGQVMHSLAAKEFFVDEGGKLKVYSLQEWGDQSYLIDNDMAVVQKDATVEWMTLNFGTLVSKMKFGSDVAGANSSAEMDGIYFATGKQHLEQTTWQIHSSPDTYSRLLYKGAVKQDAHSVYRGVIQAKPKCIRVDAYQTNNNLVLSDGARADTIPGLLIDADDLACSHGATIGNVDEDQVFYLRSRGLGEDEARKIVILGYFDEIVERMPYEFLKDWVHAHIERKLAS